MFDVHRKEISWGGRPLVFETGRIARQADGAVMTTYGDTTVLCTAVAQRAAKPSRAARSPPDMAAALWLRSRSATATLL